MIRPLTLFRAPLKGFCVFRTQLSKCCSKLSTKPSIEARKQLFLLLKRNQYLDSKFVALFQQFSSIDNHYHWSFLGFRFYPQSIFENPESTENFNKLIFQGIMTIYYQIYSDFKSFTKHFVYSGETIKVVLKIIKENESLRLESGFSCY